MKYMRLILGPIVYAVFTVVTVVEVIALLGWMAGTVGGGPGNIVVLLIPATATLFLANILVRLTDGRRNPTIKDHFRRSALCYLTTLIFLGPFSRGVQHPQSFEAVFDIIVWSVAATAVVVNAVYVIFRRHWTRVS